MWSRSLNLLFALATIVSSLTVVPLQYGASSDVTSEKLATLGRRRINRINGVVETLQERSISAAITNYEYGYIANVSVGGNTQRLLVDTGVATTWCGYQTSCSSFNLKGCGLTSCEPTKTGVLAGGNLTHAAQGDYQLQSAVEYLDTVSFAGLSVSNQAIGASFSALYYPHFIDGVLGLGPVELTKGADPECQSKVNPSKSFTDCLARLVATIPTFMDNLYGQGQISTQVLGLSLRGNPGTAAIATTGEMTFGGIDTTKFSGTLNYFPRSKNETAASYWGLDLAGMHYGSESILGGGSQAIVDSGTVLIHIPTAALNTFIKKTNGLYSTGSHLTFWDNRNLPTFKNITFTIGKATLTLTPDQYLVSAAQAIALGLSTDGIYGWISDGGSTGVTTVLGIKFLEQFYSVFDTPNARIGLAAI